ncbi:indolepyruvate oxidoreductase subunit beta [Methanolobus sp. WCC1]|jgi:indolepyruvate ferredoxin oxidoreductase beta subunit|uniref:Indolepyruvate ferredoxin oxidoreductase subunit beta n=1 Tax=Methanolobus tindarius DSM 2278 TaxID=1090322 RepID=W9DZ52_METTI|nr:MULTISPECIES: indolepyruvate oxidoreductase subunit beta [Methanolobus]ETA68651.1 indolepyruvate ferredoxin oxidoreductase, beta subunit [Methanolobus tindarius DSM 2278]MDK2831516.1 indolepyruvate ferredoxin oxidoreductase, beta subunit [Methanolobus sp.]
MSAEGISKFDLVIAGVGGQGTILASDIIGKAAVKENMSVRAAETHGMAQRGGSVVNHIRLGCELGSMIPMKGADVLLALEPSEALRYLEFLSDEGTIIVNTDPILPVTVTSGQCTYPDVDAIISKMEETHKVKAFNATELAKEAGHPQSMNVVMVGAVSSYLPVSVDTLVDCAKELVPRKTIDINVKAFEMGRSVTQG